MNSTYTEITDESSGIIFILADLGNGKFLSIPMDEANSDYQAYLEHEATAK
jgi:hypothetical protein